MKLVLKKIRKSFDRDGILLLTDQNLPSVTTVVAGTPVKGSWWGHPKGNLMYNCSNELGEQSDVMVLKLVNKKVTFLQQRHWNALLALVAEAGDWQMAGLTMNPKNLLKKVREKGAIRIDDPTLSAKEISKLATGLEEKLLVCSESIHTESGKHVRLLKSWKVAMKDKGYVRQNVSYADAIAHFEELRRKLAGSSGTKVVLPWD